MLVKVVFINIDKRLHKILPLAAVNELDQDNARYRPNILFGQPGLLAFTSERPVSTSDYSVGYSLATLGCIPTQPSVSHPLTRPQLYYYSNNK